MPPPSSSSSSGRVDPARPGEYKIRLGDSLTGGSSSQLASIKYNFKSPSTLMNTIAPKLQPASNGSGYTLKVTPPNAKPILYEGKAAQPNRRSEHVLLFDPATKEFTLEKLTTAFIFNASVFNNAHPPLAMDEGSDGEDGNEEDEDSPYDYRKFMDAGKATSAAEERKQKEEKRKEALRKSGRFDSGLEEDEPVAEEIVIPDAGRLEDDEMSDAEYETDDEDSAIPPPPPVSRPALPVRKKSPIKKLTSKPAPPPADDEDEILIPEAPAAAAEESDEDMSDVDESDDEKPHAKPAAAPVPAAPQEEAEDFDLEAALEEALDTPGGDENMPDALVVEDDDDDAPSQSRSGAAGGAGGGPVSLRDALGGGVLDEESDESEEE